jgi:replicative DNA helicase
MEASLEIESRILAVIRRKRNYHKYKSVLQQSFFQAEATRQLFTLIDEFFSSEAKKKKLTIANLKIITHQKIKNQDLKEDVLSTLRRLRHYPTIDNEVIDEAIKDFSKRQYAKRAVIECLELLEAPNPDFSIVQEHLEKAVCISTGIEKECYSYFENTDERVSPEQEEKRISMGISTLDKYMRGGAGPGELVVFLAPPERGKTLALVNTGVAALRMGKKVCHITLELSERQTARRYDLRITGRPIEILRKEPDRVRNPLASLRKTGCDLVIKDYSAHDPKVEELKAFVINYQNKMHRKFDLLIIDYADLISPTKLHKNERFGIKEVYTNIRRFANELKIPIVTASQANRKSVNKKVVTMEDFAEDFAKAAISDVVIAICQEPEELEEEICRLYIAKNRISGKHQVFRTTMRPKIMYLGDFHKFEDSEARKTVADKI